MRHGTSSRTCNVPCGVSRNGHFGRMFPYLPPLEVESSALKALADAMKDVSATNESDDSTTPAGYTYLGQFIDHDITLDLTPVPDQLVDPNMIRNFRTPQLELDSVYGLGPDAQPYLYEPNNGGPRFKLRVGKTVVGGGEPIPAELPNDLLRIEHDAIIGDKRNDENLIVAQTHLAFIKFHNKVVEKLIGDGVTQGEVFEQARKLVTWHYQWIVINDFLPRIIDSRILDSVIANGGDHYDPAPSEAFMPIEFSGAAYRLGHSMVRQVYSFNRVFTEGGLTPATLKLLFQFSGLSGEPDTRGPRVPLPSDWVIDWQRFFDLGTKTSANFMFNFARKLDPFAAEELHTLPGGGSLPLLNLLRGNSLGLPSGQSIARHLGVSALTPEEVAQGSDGAVAKAKGLHEATPLWFYVLKEASLRQNGQCLGPVGSTILAEVFVGLLKSDPNSYLLQDPGWQPELSQKGDCAFDMADLLRFVGDINPIGDGAEPGTA